MFSVPLVKALMIQNYATLRWATRIRSSSSGVKTVALPISGIDSQSDKEQADVLHNLHHPRGALLPHFD